MTRLLVLGAGISGLAAARLALTQGMTVTVYDQKPVVPSLPGAAGVASGPWEPTLLQGVDLVVASPGFAERSTPLVDAIEAGLPVWSEVEFAWRHLDAPLAAVTGTNGKTTVTEATSAMLAASGLDAPATGNIGAPLSDFVGEAHDALVVEVSSFQLRFTEEFHPVAAGVTNIAVDHLDWHGSPLAYREAKARLVANQTQSDLLVYDTDDPGAVELAQRALSRLYPVSGIRVPEGGGGVEGDLLVVGEAKIALTDLARDDPAHLVNLAMAAALALEIGANPGGVAAAAAGFSPGAHRRTVVSDVGGVLWVDDSKATNPHAALASIRAHRSVVLIAGGRAKGLDPTPLVSEPGVRLLIGIGESGPQLVEAAGDKGLLAGTLEAAVDLAAEVAQPGDTVLLAPGCASFDQFESYAQRGDRFTELVRARAEGGAA